MYKINKVSDKIDSNLKWSYPLLIIFEHLVNSFTVVFLNRTSYWNVITIVLHLLFVILAAKFKLYSPVNSFRLFLNHFFGILIQSIFMVRHINIIEVENTVGKH